MPLAFLLPTFQHLRPQHSVFLAHRLKHIQNTRHHSSQAAEVYMRPTCKPREQLVCVLSEPVLDVHLTSLWIRLLPGQRILEAELLWVAGLDVTPFCIIQQAVGGRDAQKEPSQAREGSCSGGVLHEQAPEEAPGGQIWSH